MKKLAVLVIHGMGDQGSDFANGMIDELSKRLQKAGLNPGEVAWQSCWWAPTLSSAQSTMWREMKKDNDLDFVRLRKFVLHALGDAVAYRKVATPGLHTSDVYSKITGLVGESLRELRMRTREGKPDDAAEVPLMVVGHSLGVHIMSNYIWDKQKSGAVSSGNAFEDMQTLTGIASFGCNIPLFTLASTRVQAIKFPLPVAPYFPAGTDEEAIKAVAKWRNYFDPDDILGWPLKPLSESYNRAVEEDRAINVGGVLASWNPAAHSSYWLDNDLTVPVAKSIADVLRLL